MKTLSALIATLFASASIAVFAQATPATPAKPAEPAKEEAKKADAKPAAAKPDAKAETKKALERAIPFLRRQIAARVRLRRVPELFFQFDESVERQDRIEKILIDLQREREQRETDQASGLEPRAVEPDKDES